MSERPAIKKLVRESRDFMRENKNDLIECAKPVLIPLLVFNFLNLAVYIFWPQMSHVSGYLLRFVTIYFNAVFVLSFFRTLSSDYRAENIVHPFRLQKNDIRFIAFFYFLTLLVALFFIISSMDISKAIANNVMSLTLLGDAVLILGSLWVALRFMFILPARAEGESLSLENSMALSRGVAGPLFAGILRANIGLIVISWILSIAVFAGLYFSGIFQRDEAKHIIWTWPGVFLVFIFWSAPLVVLSLMMYARAAFILSRLYQWAKQQKAAV